MKSKGVRLYGAYDIRLEEFDLPEIREDEILVRVMSDSICMSTYKLLMQGKAHKRCPQDVETRPVLIGHEFAGDIVKVGRKWRNEFQPGEKFAQQPALNYKGSLASPTPISGARVHTASCRRRSWSWAISCITTARAILKPA